MPEPILAIDFGTSTSAAILVTGKGEQPITQRSGDSTTWPSAVCFDGTQLQVGASAEKLKRVHADRGRYRAEFKLELGRDDPVDLGGQSFTVLALITTVLEEIKKAAERAAGEPVTRAVLTIPASYDEADARRALMIAAAEDAGFGVVELVPEPAAAALAPAAGPPFPEGSLVLVYDLGGGTFDTALVRVGPHGNTVLGHAAIDPSKGGHGSGGRDIDAALYDELLKSGGKPLADLVTTRRARLQLLAETEKLKRGLTEADSTEDYYGDSDVLLAATRDRLEQLAAPVIERTIDCVRAMLAGTGTDVGDVTEVLLVGGATQMPMVESAVVAAFGRPVRSAMDPQLAVVQGAARFAAAVTTRFTVPRVRRVTERPLRWPIPGDSGSATMLRWRVDKDDTFDSGQVLADVRLTDGAIWELRANRPGRLEAKHALEGTTVFDGDWLVTAMELSPESVINATKLFEVNVSNVVHSVAFNLDGLSFVTGDRFYVSAWDAGNAARKWQMRSSPDYVYALTPSPDGTRLASAAGGTVTLWEATGGRQLTTLVCGGQVRGLSFHPDGRRLATAAIDLDLRIWELGDGSYVVRSPDPVNAVRFSPDGTRLASAHPDGKVRVWSEPTGDPIAELEHPDPVYCVAFSPDRARIAAGSREGLVAIWDAATGKTLTLVSHETTEVRDVAFSSDGMLLASAGGDECRLWDAVTGDALTSVPHKQIQALAFSPDGRRLATAGTDNYARTWLVG